MDIDKLNKWADLLLDTGKRNNLVSFKDAKASTVEVLLPELEALFARAEHGAAFEVFDPGLADEEDEVGLSERTTSGHIPREEYLRLYSPKIKRADRVLIYNASVNPLSALKNIGKRAKSAIEETGVNIAYMAFGFISWNDGDAAMRAPILLIPISIENDSATEPYRIKITDSEIIVNPTFAFKLRNDYGIELPEYGDEGVGEYIAKIEALIAPLKWTVRAECKIALFSFLKINMHKDLKDNAEKILKNRGVRALLGEANLDSLTEGDVGGVPHELYTVVDADSSQTDAIELARSGRSFVLQGPPGTGKSQTITNIIAECLAEGKRVLFVSEKLAALEVVYEKLKRAGLEEFCLELHSHKANKKDVIEELCHTLRLGRSAVAARAEREIEARIGAEERLNSYVNELHKIRPTINKSLFDLYEEASAYRKAPECEFIIGNIRAKGEEYITEAESVLSAYAEYTAAVGSDYHKNPFYGYNDLDCSYSAREALRGEFTDAVMLCESLVGINGELCKYRLEAKNINEAYTLLELLELISESDLITPALFNSGSLATLRNAIEPMSKLAREILGRRRSIDSLYEPEIYELDGRLIQKRLTGEFGNIFTRLFGKEYKALINQIRLCKKDGTRVKYAEALSAARLLLEYQQKSRELASHEGRVMHLLGDGYVGADTDFAALKAELDRLARIVGTRIDLSAASKLKKADLASSREELRAILERLRTALSELGESEKMLCARFGFGGVDTHTLELSRLLDKYSGCLTNIDSLDVWCEFMKLIYRIAELDLLDFVDYTVKHRINPSDIQDAYKKIFFTQWVDAVLRDTPTLVSLSRIPHDEAVRLFRAKDELNFEINKAKIRAKLSAQRPSLDMVAQGSATAILLREGEKKRGQKSIRRLLEEIGDLAVTLKPCFLMSPLSVSTFLSANMKFDVVVFDEASQIFPQDAVGAIYRGRQLIVVGDSKQMPPSNFFNSTSYDSEAQSEEDDVTDFESILDICSSAFLQKRLRWHYRSRFEQLIAFSNKNFYDNDLVSFPSSMSDREDIGVDYFFVGGVFDRASRTNRKEAEAVVDLVFEHIEKYPDRSLGVVAFSIAQQSLIDKLIAKRRAIDTRYEAFFKSDSDEPFFVKNLETVQGDERDTIIFSVAYGKDTEGRFIHNFGPINRDGGERRLNVAVTRAKVNVKLVASIHYTDIDLSRCESVGARLLREYLDYAENGEAALSRTEAQSLFEREESELILEVAEFLRENGFRLDTGVGCSSLKVDIAVKKRGSSDYALAIECDGGAYRASRSARDRDRLRREVLERMGWRYYRIWSVDWFRNKRTERERLIAAARAAVDGVAEVKPRSAKEDEPTFLERVASEHFEFPKYQMANESELARRLGGDRLGVIRAIVDAESPVSEEWLMHRLSFLYGKDKVTSVVRDLFGYELRNARSHGIIRKDGFLFLEGGEIPMLRIPGEGGEKRELKYIHPEELKLGMREILRENITVERSSLFRLLGQKLGFTRVGEAMLEHMECALALLSAELTVHGEMLSLKNTKKQ